MAEPKVRNSRSKQNMLAACQAGGMPGWRHVFKSCTLCKLTLDQKMPTPTDILTYALIAWPLGGWLGQAIA